ncbi:MAG: hypothetical protein V4481_01685 [Patescibacteria group bacterium]
METEVTPFRVQGTTERIFVESENDGVLLVARLQLLRIGASGQFDPQSELYTVELPTPMQWEEVKRINEAIEDAPYAITDNAQTLQKKG